MLQFGLEFDDAIALFCDVSFICFEVEEIKTGAGVSIANTSAQLVFDINTGGAGGGRSVKVRLSSSVSESEEIFFGFLQTQTATYCYAPYLYSQSHCTQPNCHYIDSVHLLLAAGALQPILAFFLARQLCKVLFAIQ